MMAKIDPPKWLNVNADARIWSGHGDGATRLGWLRAPAAILAIDEYKGSFQFREVLVGTGGSDQIIVKSGYPQNWIRIEDTSTEPYEEPGTDPVVVPDPVPSPEIVAGDAELGAAFRTIVSFLSSHFS